MPDPKLDHEAAGLWAAQYLAQCEEWLAACPGGPEVADDVRSNPAAMPEANLARCYLDAMARLSRLEAYVREHGKCPTCWGAGRIARLPSHKLNDCEDCSGTGLTKAAREARGEP